MDTLPDKTVHEFRLKKRGFIKIAGIDEVGRGPLAGPVIAVACILPKQAYFKDLNDSKLLNTDKREELFQRLLATEGVTYGVGRASHEEVDQINVLQATFVAMKRAIQGLGINQPDFLLIDGNQSPKFEIPYETLIRGDSQSVSIAAASILAKVLRDREMIELDKQWPHYGFRFHKGYGTKQHLEAIQKWGPCPIHRKTFRPIYSSEGVSSSD